MSNFFDTDLQSTEFTVTMRGYDRAQVDAYAHKLLAAMKTARQHRADAERRLDEIRMKLRHTEERIAGLERRLADSDAAIEENERPTLAGLGARVEKLLRAAEIEADEQRESAHRKAADIRAKALAEAASTTESARAEAHAVTTSAAHDAADIRAAASREAEDLRTSARRDHDLKRADVTRETEQLRAVAHSEATETRASAEHEGAMQRAVADREVTQLRASIAREVDDRHAQAAALMAEAADTRQSEIQELALALAEKRERAERDESARHILAITTATDLVEEAEQRAHLAEQRSRETEIRAQERVVEADRRASDTLTRARMTAAQLLVDAEAEAISVRSQVDTETQGMISPLKAELEALTSRRDSVTAHLGELQRQLGSVAASPLRDLTGDPSIVINRQRAPYEAEGPTQQIPAVRSRDLGLAGSGESMEPGIGGVAEWRPAGLHSDVGGRRSPSRVGGQESPRPGSV